jgi:hypothetical protein
MPGNNPQRFAMYLTGWQRRLVKDVLGVDCTHLHVPLKDAPLLKYAVRRPAEENSPRMYLTEWQIRQMKDEVGVSCDFLELNATAPIVLYGPLPGLAKD